MNATHRRRAAPGLTEMSDARIERRRPWIGQPLLAASVRRRVVAIVVASMLVVVVPGVLFARQTTADRFDRAIDAPIIGWFGTHPGLAFRLAAPGSLVPAAAFTAAIVIGCLFAGRANGAVLGLLAVPVSVGLTERVLKPAFGRTYLGNLTYPSGHTTAVFAIAATVAVLLTPRRPGSLRAPRMAISVLMFALGCVVAAAVTGLPWHYFTDTVAGAAVGIGAVCGLALVLDLPALRSCFTRASRAVAATGRR